MKTILFPATLRMRHIKLLKVNRISTLQQHLASQNAIMSAGDVSLKHTVVVELL